jgi:hypothetical protein
MMPALKQGFGQDFAADAGAARVNPSQAVLSRPIESVLGTDGKTLKNQGQQRSAVPTSQTFAFFPRARVCARTRARTQARGITPHSLGRIGTMGRIEGRQR